MAYSATAGDIWLSRSSSLSATFCASSGNGFSSSCLRSAGDFRGGGIAFAQFALDGAHLFAQEKIPLRLRHRIRDVVLNLRADLNDLEFAVEQRAKLLQPFAHVVRFQQMLPIFETEIQVRRDQIAQRPGHLGVDRRDLHLVRHRRRELDDLAELLRHVPRQRGDFSAFRSRCLSTRSKLARR